MLVVRILVVLAVLGVAFVAVTRFADADGRQAGSVARASSPLAPAFPPVTAKDRSGS